MSNSQQVHPVRLGIVGCGAITENAHLPAAMSSPLVDLVSITDVSPARLEYMQGQYGLDGKCVAHYQEMVDRVEAVILALPNHLHEPIGTDFLRQGIHVLCEKPLALTSSECSQMCNAAKTAGAVLAVGYMTRFYPSTILTKELMETGLLGRVRSFRYEFGTEGGWAPLSGYNLSRATSGGGVLVVSGSHFLDRMLYLFGEVRIVQYSDDNRGGVEANCMLEVIGKVAGVECSGAITLSKTHRLANELRIEGDRGVLIVKEGQSRSVTFLPAGTCLSHEITSCPGTTVDQGEDYYRVQLEDFARAVRLRQSPLVSGEEGSASVALIEQCYASIRPLREDWCDVTIPNLLTAMPRRQVSIGV